MPQIAVLTGDIVNSTQLSPDELEEIMGYLQETAHKIQDFNADLKVWFARRGGDGWQCVLSHPEIALQAALMLQASLKSALLVGQAKTRIAIATGEGHFSPSAPGDPNAAHGPAFIASGRLLENLPKDTMIAHAGGGTLSAATLLVDTLIEGWTQAQALAVFTALSHPKAPQKDLAKTLGISRQAVAQALNAAGYRTLVRALELIKTDLIEAASSESPPNA